MFELIILIKAKLEKWWIKNKFMFLFDVSILNKIIEGFVDICLLSGFALHYAKTLWTIAIRILRVRSP